MTDPNYNSFATIVKPEATDTDTDGNHMLRPYLLNLDDFSTPLNPPKIEEPKLSQANRRAIFESPEARARRLARNAERMRARRSNESLEEHKKRLSRNAEANRMRRHNETDIERAIRHVREAARQRLRRAMETPEKRQIRLAKLSERMRMYRANESFEQRQKRLADLARRARERTARKAEARKLGLVSKQDADTPPNSIMQQENHEIPVPPLTLISNTPATAIAQQNINPICTNSLSNAYTFENRFPAHNQVFRPNYFPELPNHVLPPPLNFNFQYAAQNPTALTYIQTAPMTLQQQNVQSPQLQPPNQPQIPPVQDQLLRPVLGRPVKIFPSNDYRSVAPTQQLEAQRQQTMSIMLEEQINKMLSTPKTERGRKRMSDESEERRQERLRKMAETRRIQRANETEEERRMRLTDLSARARKRREMLKAVETEDQRRERLSKQAEYARNRRVKNLSIVKSESL